MSEVVAANSVVSLLLTLKDEDGNVLDQNTDRDKPLQYLHGHHTFVPGLEAQMTGKSVGDAFDAVVQPADGFGEASGERTEIPRDNFPADLDIQPGMAFGAQSPDGRPVQLLVLQVADDVVTVTPDHPLAGVTLYFSVEIVAIRQATAEELDHGHSHGPGGHH